MLSTFPLRERFRDGLVLLLCFARFKESREIVRATCQLVAVPVLHVRNEKNPQF